MNYKWLALDFVLHVIVLALLIPLLMPPIYINVVNLLGGAAVIAIVLLVLEVALESILKKER